MKAVSSDNRTLRTVLRDSLRSRAIAFIGYSFARNSRRFILPALCRVLIKNWGPPALRPVHDQTQRHVGWKDEYGAPVRMKLGTVM
jgi:hypothetical protein